MSKVVNVLSLSVVGFALCFGAPNVSARQMKTQDQQLAPQEHSTPPPDPKGPEPISCPPKGKPSSVNHHARHKENPAAAKDSVSNHAADQNRDKDKPEEKNPKAGVEHTK